MVLERSVINVDDINTKSVYYYVGNIVFDSPSYRNIEGRFKYYIHNLGYPKVKFMDLLDNDIKNELLELKSIFGKSLNNATIIFRGDIKRRRISIELVNLNIRYYIFHNDAIFIKIKNGGKNAII